MPGQEQPARSPGAQLVAVAVLAGWKAELGERRGEAEVASPSWARPFVVAGGSTCALNRALVQAGIEAKSARAVSSLLVRTAGDGGCSAPAATRGGRRPLFCGGEPRSSEGL